MCSLRAVACMHAVTFISTRERKWCYSSTSAMRTMQQWRLHDKKDELLASFKSRKETPDALQQPAAASSSVLGKGKGKVKVKDKGKYRSGRVG